MLRTRFQRLFAVLLAVALLAGTAWGWAQSAQVTRYDWYYWAVDKPQLVDIRSPTGYVILEGALKSIQELPDACTQRRWVAGLDYRGSTYCEPAGYAGDPSRTRVTYFKQLVDQDQDGYSRGALLWALVGAAVGLCFWALLLILTLVARWIRRGETS